MLLACTNLGINASSDVPGKIKSLTHMLYKDALTVRLATAPEFLEHHPTCYEWILVPATVKSINLLG